MHIIYNQRSKCGPPTLRVAPSKRAWVLVNRKWMCLWRAVFSL